MGCALFSSVRHDFEFRAVSAHRRRAWECVCLAQRAPNSHHLCNARPWFRQGLGCLDELLARPRADPRVPLRMLTDALLLSTFECCAWFAGLTSTTLLPPPGSVRGGPCFQSLVAPALRRILLGSALAEGLSVDAIELCVPLRPLGCSPTEAQSLRLSAAVAAAIGCVPRGQWAPLDAGPVRMSGGACSCDAIGRRAPTRVVVVGGCWRVVWSCRRVRVRVRIARSSGCDNALRILAIHVVHVIHVAPLRADYPSLRTQITTRKKGPHLPVSPKFYPKSKCCRCLSDSASQDRHTYLRAIPETVKETIEPVRKPCSTRATRPRCHPGVKPQTLPRGHPGSVVALCVLESICRSRIL